MLRLMPARLRRALFRSRRRAAVITRCFILRHLPFILWLMLMFDSRLRYFDIYAADDASYVTLIFHTLRCC